MNRQPVAVIVGTRPEAIKMAPVIRELSRSKLLRPITVSTSQHRELVDQVFRSFGIKSDHDLRVMRRSQTLWNLSAKLAKSLGEFFDRYPVAAALVQGDTSTAFFGGLCAYYHKIPVGHVEAGLRTGNRYAPFPEEANRKLLATLATWHFAPTIAAAKRLCLEAVNRKTIYLTGNTVVDALHWMAAQTDESILQRLLGVIPKARKLVVVTCHRRESLGAPLHEVARGIARLASANPEVSIVFPVHPNPAVRAAVKPPLSRLSNVILRAPLPYDQFVACLQRAHLVISDSGGVQEEATALGKPVLVLRNETERPEGIQAGALRLVGTDAQRIAEEGQRMLDDSAAYRQLSRSSNVFGDGKAAERIVRILEQALASEPTACWPPQGKFRPQGADPSRRRDQRTGTASERNPPVRGASLESHSVCPARPRA